MRKFEQDRQNPKAGPDGGVELSMKCNEGLPWELLYADDLVLITESLDELRTDEKVEAVNGCDRV